MFLQILINKAMENQETQEPNETIITVTPVVDEWDNFGDSIYF
jgi:hypothetical protein